MAGINVSEVEWHEEVAESDKTAVGLVRGSGDKTLVAKAVGSCMKVFIG